MPGQETTCKIELINYIELLSLRLYCCIFYFYSLCSLFAMVLNIPDAKTVLPSLQRRRKGCIEVTDERKIALPKFHIKCAVCGKLLAG
ncbi:hypothetical protein Ngar_c21200 [Candidatus Nitrososphaera gargensis Ga9.2]|uniref:Uncharacterized protein n=1 Tax=Nitrososphaera gargensis (strain Ga9.2) TaxID=1237085 RepID=K0ICE9_NITGG|nr:hypothetical protein Ngar_c21200 [Candidatus Nitrososphaera gargensis Ga9.2]